MKTLLISTFANINSVSNNRLLSIINHIIGEKLVITTDFCHSEKRYYTSEEMEHPCQVNFHVPSYSKNISIRRIWSHLVFAIKVAHYLKSSKENPTTIYCTMPTSASAYVCAKYCKKHKIKFIIDVIDLWPDSLLPLVNCKFLIKKFLFPWTYLTHYAYKSADVIVGESVAYANEAKKYNDHAKIFPIYLGVDMHYISKVKVENPVLLQKPDNEIWIGYAGSLGNSYDFKTLLDAVKAIHGKYKYKLWFIGDGVRRKEIERYIGTYGLNADITGFLNYDKLLGYLSYCDIAINIFRASTKVVFSYKFNDYVAMGCFVLNSLKGETSEMVDEFKIGRNFDFTNHLLPEVLEDTLANWKEYSVWGNNMQRVIDEKLDKEKIYSVLENIFLDYER